MTSVNYQLGCITFWFDIPSFETHLCLVSSLCSRLFKTKDTPPASANNSAYFAANITAGPGDIYDIQQPIHYDALCWRMDGEARYHIKDTVASLRHFTSFLFGDTFPENEFITIPFPFLSNVWDILQSVDGS